MLQQASEAPQRPALLSTSPSELSIAHKVGPPTVAEGEVKHCRSHSRKNSAQLEIFVFKICLIAFLSHRFLPLMWLAFSWRGV
jgi:hypothetical protein